MFNISKLNPALSVNAKISLGFAIVLVLHVSIAMISHFGLDKAAVDLSTYNRLRQEAIRISEIDRMVGALQENVLLFTHEGHRGPAARARRLHAMLRAEIKAGTVMAESEDATYLQGMLNHLNTHEELFEAVSFDRDRRSRLFDDEMTSLSEKTKARLAMISKGDASIESIVNIAMSSLQAAENNALRFMHSPDSTYVRHAKVNLAGFRDDLARIRKETQASDVENGVSEARRLVDAYENALIQMVQATRGYLHLVNVVMAGETAEFLRLTHEFREYKLQGTEELSASMDNAFRDYRWFSDSVSLVTIILGVFAASWIGRNVAPPLNAITKTLVNLSQGRKQNTIPGIARRDELGRLASAAQVFREHTVELERLLAESKSAEHRLQAYAEELERRNKELDEFTYVASHDLQEPLRKLTTFGNLLAKDLGGDLPERAARDVHFMTDAATRMNTLVVDLLHLSRAGRSAMKSECVSLRGAAESACELLNDRIKESGASIEFDGLPEVNGDITLLTQLFQNLIGNALKFCDPDQTPRIRITSEERDGKTIVGVADNGIGIDAKYANNIFSPFKRLHGRNEYDGSGIGLSICRKVVERHGGNIWVESIPGKGSHFCFTIDSAWEEKTCDVKDQPLVFCS